MELLNSNHTRASGHTTIPDLLSKVSSEQRLQIEGILAESPSLRPSVAAMLGEAHAIARARAIAETGLADEVFPEACPFTATDVTSRGFLPEHGTQLPH